MQQQFLGSKVLNMSAMLIGCKCSRQSRAHLLMLPLPTATCCKIVRDHDIDMRTEMTVHKTCSRACEPCKHAWGLQG